MNSSVRLNLRGEFICCRHHRVCRIMKGCGEGSFFNVLSCWQSRSCVLTYWLLEKGSTGWVLRLDLEYSCLQVICSLVWNLSLPRSNRFSWGDAKYVKFENFVEHLVAYFIVSSAVCTLIIILHNIQLNLKMSFILCLCKYLSHQMNALCAIIYFY